MRAISLILLGLTGSIVGAGDLGWIGYCRGNQNGIVIQIQPSNGYAVISVSKGNQSLYEGIAAVNTTDREATHVYFDDGIRNQMNLLIVRGESPLTDSGELTLRGKFIAFDECSIAPVNH